MVEVNRRKGESFEGFFRRFSRRLQGSGKQLEVRKRKHHSVDPNKTAVRASALRRQAKKEKIEYLLRSGKMTIEDVRESGKRGGRR